MGSENLVVRSGAQDRTLPTEILLTCGAALLMTSVTVTHAPAALHRAAPTELRTALIALTAFTLLTLISAVIGVEHPRIGFWMRAPGIVMSSALGGFIGGQATPFLVVAALLATGAVILLFLRLTAHAGEGG
ncbi:hypothetical protein KIH74_19670 [Kineosporia sp. J2-2]|uniref:Uncharacterized protein n=1 Tax=Kineosporia corallincola TaxID=2835133 RepID=A0ABS5TJ93_9ACTN|nr:hypothetical protein [Kineosporia corallincola]MBT0771169.1 hypothetical protein [Kineosporia corallincola]